MSIVAVGLGVNVCKDPLIPVLLCCERDAREFTGLLKDGFGFDVHYLEERVTEHIEERIEALGERLKPGDTFIFYFSGHGKAHWDDHYLLLPGARLAAFESGSVAVSGVLSYRNLKHITSGPRWQGVHRFFIIDACRGHLTTTKSAGDALAFDGEYLLKDPKRRAARKEPGDENLTLLNSCALGASAVELPGEGHGVFTAALLELLRGRKGRREPLVIDRGFVDSLGSAMTAKARHFGLPPELHHQPALVGEGLRLLLDVPGANDEDDEVEWELAQVKGLAALEAYVRRKPLGRHRQEALKLIAGLSQQVPVGTTTPAVAVPQVAAVVEDVRPLPEAELAGAGKAADTRQPEKEVRGAEETIAAGGLPAQGKPAWLKAGGGVLVLVGLVVVVVMLTSGKKEVPSAPSAASAAAEAAAPLVVAVAAAKPSLPAVESIDGKSPEEVKDLQNRTAAALGVEARGKPCAECLEEVVIPAGRFEMGSNDKDSEKPVHRVTIGRPFALARTEVTVGQYMKCVDAGGCRPPEWLEPGSKDNIHTGSQDYYKKLGTALTGTDQPIVGVSWENAGEYVKWLSARTGKAYRLPSEAEWEYAARGGTKTHYWWGDDASHEYMNYGKDDCCGGLARGRDRWEYTAPVGQFPANAFGLHDMHGNVWEWVQDRWHGSYIEAGRLDDGNAWESGTAVWRVLRGGSWSHDPQLAHSANRKSDAPAFRDYHYGFRPARTLP